MKKFREFAQVDEAKNSSIDTPERMHKIIVDRMKELNMDRRVISKMPAPNSTEWREVHEAGKMIQLTKDMTISPKNLGTFGFIYENYSVSVSVGMGYRRYVIHLDIKFEYKSGERKRAEWIDRYDINGQGWLL